MILNYDVRWLIIIIIIIIGGWLHPLDDMSTYGATGY
jgi:hypothetical protein